MNAVLLIAHAPLANALRQGALHVFPDAAADIVFAMPFQAIDLRKAIPDELAKSIIVEVQDSEGIAVLRTFQPDWTYKKEVDTFLSKVACAPV